MKYYLIKGNLTGSFGGTERYDVVIAKNEDDALLQAYYLAKEVYQSYEGNYGLLTEDECEDEEQYNEEIENWIEYEIIKEVDKDFDIEKYEANL